MLCGEFGKPDDLVFEGLMNAAWINRPLKKWILDAGISKNITFHCFRHTFATLQIANGTDIYIVKDLLGHTNVKTTQIYAKVMNEKKNEAVKAIKLNIKNNYDKRKIFSFWSKISCYYNSDKYGYYKFYDEVNDL